LPGSLNRCLHLHAASFQRGVEAAAQANAHMQHQRAGGALGEGNAGTVSHFALLALMATCTRPEVGTFTSLPLKQKPQAQNHAHRPVLALVSAILRVLVPAMQDMRRGQAPPGRLLRKAAVQTAGGTDMHVLHGGVRRPPPARPCSRVRPPALCCVCFARVPACAAQASRSYRSTHHLELACERPASRHVTCWRWRSCCGSACRASMQMQQMQPVVCIDPAQTSSPSAGAHLADVWGSVWREG